MPRQYIRKDFEPAKEYIRHNITKNGGKEYFYYFVYDHTEDITTDHIKSDKPEYIKYNGHYRYVYYEDISRRESFILDANKFGRTGRPKGAKDKQPRKSRKRKEIK